tara:strand:- start:416 stop:739 length:324 start_codon:yes stop_codon:yes gene_type:complete
MAKNPMGKTRDIEEPYAIFRAAGDFELRVLKTYKMPKNEEKDIYSRWFTGAKSPMTYGSWEYGDTYRKEIVDNMLLIEASQEFIDAYGKDGKNLRLTEEPKKINILT